MEELYKNLEFDRILSEVAALSSAEPVAERILAAEPTAHITDADKLLTQTEDAMRILASHRPDLSFEDILPIVNKARVGAMLQPYEFLKIRRSILCLRSLKNCVETAEDCDSLKDITAWVRVAEDLECDIDRAIENENDLRDSASDKLYSLRRAISRANAKLKERLDGLTRKSDISKFLQDNIVTVRGGRYVVPVKAECRSSVKGLVHDVSSTGSTVFIEPFAIVDANNELITLKNEEQAEIERILIELGGAVVRDQIMLEEGQRVLTECGVIFAKAEYARKTNSFKPALNKCGTIRLNKARHPLIAPESVVPVDIALDKRILLISGPNTGGKTVVLKTVGLFSLMAASGMFLPTADKSEICIFDSVFCDIGDSQSIAQSLSTFSAHVKILSYIIENAGEGSLVLLDEVGDGTDPDEGAALAIAIIKKISAIGATAVITTHFNSVKQFALGCNDVANACMQFDNINFKPTYKLLSGVTGSSYALEIAESLGLDKSVISDARAALSKEKVAFDTLMQETEKLRNAAMSDLAEIEKLKSAAVSDSQAANKLKLDYERKLADINENSRNMIRRAASEYTERAEEIIDEIKQQLKNADEAALFAARKAAKKLEDGVPGDSKKPERADAPPKPSELTDGTRVYVSGLNKEGTVCGNVRGNKAVVAIGSIKTEIPVSSLTIIIEKATKQNARMERSVAEPENREIMLLGYTVDDAVTELERIIDDIPPRSTIRVVHGKGTGALGKGIQAYLRTNRHVKSFRYGRYGEGDTGVTIVEIR